MDVLKNRKRYISSPIPLEIQNPIAFVLFRGRFFSSVEKEIALDDRADWIGKNLDGEQLAEGAVRSLLRFMTEERILLCIFLKKFWLCFL